MTTEDRKQTVRQKLHSSVLAAGESIDDTGLQALRRISRDILDAETGALTTPQVRCLVDMYYQIQQARITAGGQVRASTGQEPTAFVGWLFEMLHLAEQRIQRALQRPANATAVGRWAQSICGIGPVLAAGLGAHIDITQAPTVGHIWRFAGLDPTDPWNKSEKRPWNADLKVLCWKIGESFILVSSNPKDFYGRFYVERKALEIKRNEAGVFQEQAQAMLAKKRWRPDAEAPRWYAGRYSPPIFAELLALPLPQREAFLRRRRGEPGSGLPMLPPAHIQARARRYAVKIFLAHYHAVAYYECYGVPAPKPYILTQPGHTHEIVCPNWPF